MRQLVIDTETTGLEPQQGHRIIEIGCVELIDRRRTGETFQRYINPERPVESGARSVHGIDNDFLADKPRFAEIVEMFLAFVGDAELIIHNAPFDVGFLNRELSLLEGAWTPIDRRCSIIDSLTLARRLYPGQKNSLDALCRRLAVDAARRDRHGALVDAELLAEVYLAMTGGQSALLLEGERRQKGEETMRPLSSTRPPLPILRADAEECAAHEKIAAALHKKGGTQRAEPRV